MAGDGEAFLYSLATCLLMEDYCSQLNSGTNPDTYKSLSEREALKLFTLGYTAAQIGEKLAFSPKTVETYRLRIMHE
jgi:DNA-binding NarL/FixJ family response regulator